MKPDYQTAINHLDLLTKLQAFGPIIIGTPPLGIAIENSDIDIACSAQDFDQFINHCQEYFGDLQAYHCKDFILGTQRTILISFLAENWEFELFCQSVPTRKQWGVRHFYLEQRLLKQIPSLRAPVIQLKQQGIKTEPAFAQLLGLKGDPYEAILDLEDMSDEALIKLLKA